MIASAVVVVVARCNERSACFSLLYLPASGLGGRDKIVGRASAVYLRFPLFAVSKTLRKTSGSDSRWRAARRDGRTLDSLDMLFLFHLLCLSGLTSSAGSANHLGLNNPILSETAPRLLSVKAEDSVSRKPPIFFFFVHFKSCQAQCLLLLPSLLVVG